MTSSRVIWEGSVMEVAFRLNFGDWKEFCQVGIGSNDARENEKHNNLPILKCC